VSGTVWLVETGEYQDRMVWVVAASLPAAVKAVKEGYGPPYVVRWEEKLDQDNPCLVGHFEAVLGKSSCHTAVYDFIEWDVEDEPVSGCVCKPGNPCLYHHGLVVNGVRRPSEVPHPENYRLRLAAFDEPSSVFATQSEEVER
jgi:hypothetical protein